jgi:hypothetical protein
VNIFFGREPRIFVCGENVQTIDKKYFYFFAFADQKKTKIKWRAEFF